MRISVVIPSFNRAAPLERALQSVVAQRSPVDEIIVVDDGSTDGSAERITRRFDGIRLIRQPNLGVSAARNRGIAAARHEWIALLDSDDSWQADKTERLRATALSRRPGYELYHSDEIWIRRGRRVNPMHKHRKNGGWIFRACLPRCVISPSAAVIRKTTLESLGLFDEALPACEDYDLWLRLCHRYPVCYIDRPLITKYGGHDDQLSQRYPAMDRFRIRSLARLLDSATLARGDFDAAREVMLNKLDILINGAMRHRNQDVLDEFVPLREGWRNTGSPEAAC